MGKKLIVGVNDLKSVNPALASEWNNEKNGKLLPENISANSHNKVWWKGKCGHEWKSTVANRNLGYGCPICSGKQVLIGFNDLESRNPNVASEWNYERNGDLKPNEVTSGSSKKVWWKGKCGHEWKASIAYRNIGTGCPICSGKHVLIGFNDLASQIPAVASEWNYEKNGKLKPEAITLGSDRKVWWKCSKGHEWVDTVSNRKSGLGCPICSGKQVLRGFNDLKTIRPDLASEWNYEKNRNVKPTDVSVGSGKKVWWKCSKGHEWKTRIASRSRFNGTGCPFCNESHLEKTLREVLKDYRYIFQEQVTFDSLTGTGGNPLSYDFAIYDDDRLDALIECQGAQHYEPIEFYGGEDKYKIQLEHDRLKQEFCQMNHILLIEIPYTYSDEEIEAIFSR